MFIRRMVESSRYAQTMGLPREGIVYTRCGRHSPSKETEAVQDEAGTYQPVVEPSQTQSDSQTAPTHGCAEAEGVDELDVHSSYVILIYDICFILIRDP